MDKIISKLQLITSNQKNFASLEVQIKEFLAGGGSWVQLRMKGALIDDVEIEAVMNIDAIKDKNGTLIINDFPEICHIAGDGVHLGKNDMPINEAREFLGNDYIIGGTANNLEEYLALTNNPNCDYIGLGPLRFTSSKKNLAPVLDFEGIKSIISSKKNKPVIAVGGINLEDIPKLLDIGIDGVAVSSAIIGQKDIKKITNQFLELLNK